LAQNGATDAEIAILLTDRVELNAMASDALIEMIERKLKEHGLEKVVPDDKLLEETYRAFRHSDELREAFEEAERDFKATEITAPEDLREQVCKILEQNQSLRWDDAVRIVLGDTIDDIRADKQKVKNAAGDFTQADDDEEDDGP
jgi:hypothetical protein